MIRFRQAGAINMSDVHVRFSSMTPRHRASWSIVPYCLIEHGLVVSVQRKNLGRSALSVFRNIKESTFAQCERLVIHLQIFGTTIITSNYFSSNDKWAVSSTTRVPKSIESIRLAQNLGFGKTSVNCTIRGSAIIKVDVSVTFFVSTASNNTVLKCSFWVSVNSVERSTGFLDDVIRVITSIHTSDTAFSNNL